jgi:hypothetical protein
LFDLDSLDPNRDKHYAMPELPEVNRVAHILRRVALNTVVEGVQTTEDTIVYSGGITNLDFVGLMAYYLSFF